MTQWISMLSSSYVQEGIATELAYDLMPGMTYTIAFFAAANRETNAEVYVTDAAAPLSGNDVVDYELVGFETVSDKDWQRYSFTFTVSGVADKLMLRANYTKPRHKMVSIDDVVLLGDGACRFRCGRAHCAD